MSCRRYLTLFACWEPLLTHSRADKTRLVGCKIGDVAIRGCSRGCCPYPDSEVLPPFPTSSPTSNAMKVSGNTRHHLLTQYWAPEYDPPNPEQQPEGRAGLYFNQCMSSYGPKFICPERPCRRSIKPVYDPDRFEYDISEWQDWRVRPLWTSPELVEVRRNSNRLHSRQSVLNGEKAAFEKLRNQYYNDPSSLSEEERDFVKKNDPEAWWRTVVSTKRVWWQVTVNLKRCPSCGKEALRVGSNFRIPKRKDEKAWREIEDMIREGEDMVAKFSPCATSEEWKNMVDRANVIREERNKGEGVSFAG